MRKDLDSDLTGLDSTTRRSGFSSSEAPVVSGERVRLPGPDKGGGSIGAQFTPGRAEMNLVASEWREIAERLELALGVSGLGAWEWDIASDHETWSAEMARMFGYEPGVDGGSIEKFFSLLHPEDAAQARIDIAKAIEAGEGELEGEFRIFRHDTGEMRWFQGRARVYSDPETGRAVRIIGVNGDITERRRAEERRQFLADLFERTRGMLDSTAVADETLRSVGRYLRLSRYMFAGIDYDSRLVSVERDWCTDGISSIVGVWPLSAWGDVMDELASGRTAITRVCTEASWTGNAPYAPIGLTANVTVPLFRDGRWSAVFCAQMCGVNRDWSADDVSLLETVARQMWLVIENARLYQTARLEEERFRVLTEAASQKVWRSGANGSPDDMPEWRSYTGQTRAEVSAFGWMEAIHPDDRSTMRNTWMEAIERRDLFACEYRLRGADGVYRWFFSRGVPLFAEDGSLREYIGTWLDIDARKQVEAAQEKILEEQRHIAETLQRSLLLTPPASALPGIELATHYAPAWMGAEVGGDFFDAFAVEAREGSGPEAIAMVVGDVTGKGLEAAAYTAEVKFALRAYLRESPNPGTALERLNNFLIDSQRMDRQEMGALVSLATVVVWPQRREMFVAVAGAEPPMIVRAATGMIEEAAADGIMLGVEPKALYTVARYDFQPGDLMAMTSDGITEARDPMQPTAFFGTEGLCAALHNSLPLGDLQEMCHNIVQTAKAFGGGRLRDDVCLLLARAK